ncbi:MAG: thiolase family protein [Deltaproteobacteria bacterium]|nr:thiolase family protein [Deltaproteobacteria bacterium]
MSSSKINVEGKVVIVGAVRTPIGAMGGALASFQAEELATRSIKAVLEQSGVQPKHIEYTCFGWVMQDPRSPNVAKTAAELAGVPVTAPGTTFHENCASGAAAAHSLARRILLGEVEIGIAGGVESMSNVPRLLHQGRLKGQTYGDFTLVDGVMGALFDAHAGEKGELMGLLSERLAERYGVSREEQDDVAFRSHQNALRAWKEGMFAGYVVPVEIPQRKGEPIVVAQDEGPKDIARAELAKPKPYFKKDGGTITGMNSSTINDGAAALVLASPKKAAELGLKPLAALHSFQNVGVHRDYMGEGAFKVIPPLLDRAGLRLADVDFFEVNEAFAVVVGAAYKFLDGLGAERTNQWGSGISLGHPVGCTGARQIVDMVHQLHRRDAKIGVTSRCVGGGMGSAEVLVRM